MNFSRVPQNTSRKRGCALEISLLALLSLSPLAAGEEARRPNIVLVLADDLGYGDLAWPGRIRAAVTDATASSIDLFPTFASVAGVSTDRMTLDGVDLGPLLRHGQPPADRRLFWRKNQLRAVRSGPWKLCVTSGRAELYNLDDDLGEQRDLAAEKQELVKELLSAWSAWERDVDASAP